MSERGVELSGAVWCDFERWSGGANTHLSGEREFSPLSSAHMLWSVSVCMSVCVSVSVCMSVCVSV